MLQNGWALEGGFLQNCPGFGSRSQLFHSGNFKGVLPMYLLFVSKSSPFQTARLRTTLVISLTVLFEPHQCRGRNVENFGARERARKR